MLHDQTKLKEYIRANFSFSDTETSQVLFLEGLKKLCERDLGVSYYENELVKAVYEVSGGLGRVTMTYKNQEKKIVQGRVWYLNPKLNNSRPARLVKNKIDHA